MLSITLVLSFSLMLFSGISFRVLIKRLVPLQLFLIVVAGFLPFTLHVGEAAGRLFGLIPYYHAGLERAVEVFLRVNSIVIASLVLLGTLLPEQVGHALARLGVPHKLVQLFLMTVRYISVLSKEFQRLRLAMKARAFQPGSNLHTWKSYGWLMGMLLVRSLERADRVVKAMKCRGYDGQFVVLEEHHWQRSDSLFIGCVSMMLGLLLSLDVVVS
jgi:cobalt/nickel transport system permease protein